MGSSFDESSSQFKITLNLKKPADDVFNIRLVSKVSNNKGLFIPIETPNIEKKSTDSNIFTSLFLSESFIEENCKSGENENSFSYTCAIKFEFHATIENKIYSIENASLSISRSKLSKAIISTKVKILENTLCDCLIRKDIPSALSFCSNPPTCNVLSSSPQNTYTLHSTLNLMHELAEEKDRDNFKLAFLKAMINWEGYSLDITNNILAVGTEKGVKLAVPLDVVGDDVRITILSSIANVNKEGKNNLRRALEGEGVDEALMMEFGPIVVNAQEQDGTFKWSYVYFSVAGVVFVAFSVLISVKLRKKCRKQAKQSLPIQEKPKVPKQI
jgi:hypothetical protein